MSAQERLKVVIDGVSDGAQRAFDDVQQGAQGVSDKLKGTGRNVQRFGRRTTRELSGPLLAAGGALAGTALKAAHHGDAIAKAADQAGFGTDAYQEWNHALSLGGMNSDDTRRALGRLNQRMSGARDMIGPYAEAFEDLGVSVKDAGGEMRPAEDVMNDTMNALAGIESESERARLAGRLFGTQVGRKLLPTLADGEAGMEAMREEAHELGLVIGEDTLRANEDFVDATDKLRRQFGMMVTNIGNKVIPILTDKLMPAIQQHVIPAFERIANKIGQAVEWFAKLDPRIQAVIGGALGFAAVLGPVAVIVGKLLVVLGNLVAGIGSVIKFFGILTKALLANPFALVIVAVAALAYAIYHYWDEIVETVQAAIDWIWDLIGPWVEGLRSLITDWLEDNRAAFADTWEAIQDHVATAIEFVRDVIDRVTGFITTLWDTFGDSIMSIAEAVWDYIKRTVENAIRAVQAIIDTVMAVIRGDWDAAWDGIKRLLGVIWDQIKAIIEVAFRIIAGIIEGVLAGISATWSAIWGAISSTASAIWEGIKGLIASAIESVRGTIDSILAAIRGLWEGGWDAITAAVSGAWTNIVTAVATGIGDVLGWVRDLPGRILSALGDLGSLLLGAGRSLITGFIRGIRAGFDRVRNTLSGLTDMLPDWKGPEQRDRTILADAGGLLMQGLGDGIEGGYRQVRNKLSKVTEGLQANASASMHGMDARLATAPAGGQGGSVNGRGRQTIVVELDGRVLARAVGDGLSDELRVRLGRR